MKNNEMSVRYKLTVISLLIFFIFTTDQATKFWAVRELMGEAPHIYLNGLFQFVYAENPGAFLGFGGGWSREVRFVIFALIVFFGLGGMLWYMIKKENIKINLYAYSFILAGGLGNLWDRVFHEDGHVVDFMMMELGGPLRTGVLNVADVFIVMGVLLALLAEPIMKKINQQKT